MAVRGCEGTAAPPTTAPFGGAFGPVSSVVTSFVRRHAAAVAASAHPIPAANAVPAAALDHRACEQAASRRRREVCAHRPAARRLPRDRDVVAVTAERGDVAVHPSERGLLVEDPLVARRAIGRLAVE
jgi:hypothetical protein